MTTQDCAQALNDAAGDRVFDDRMVRQRVQDGELECVNPVRRPRERIKITRPAFVAYVERCHRHLLERVKQQLNIAA